MNKHLWLVPGCFASFWLAGVYVSIKHGEWDFLPIQTLFFICNVAIARWMYRVSHREAKT